MKSNTEASNIDIEPHYCNGRRNTLTTVNEQNLPTLKMPHIRKEAIRFLTYFLADFDDCDLPRDSYLSSIHYRDQLSMAATEVTYSLHAGRLFLPQLIYDD